MPQKGMGVQVPPRTPKHGKFPAKQTSLEHAAPPYGEAAMTAPLIAPLIPPRARPSGREHGRTGTTRPLPVAAAPGVPAVPGALPRPTPTLTPRRPPPPAGPKNGCAHSIPTPWPGMTGCAPREPDGSTRCARLSRCSPAHRMHVPAARSRSPAPGRLRHPAQHSAGRRAGRQAASARPGTGPGLAGGAARTADRLQAPGPRCRGTRV